MNEKKNQFDGLSAQQVILNRQKYGENILTPPQKDSLVKRFLEKLTGPFGHWIPGWTNGDPLIFILEMAAMLSIFIACAEYYGWLGLTSDAGAGVFFEPVGILMAIFLATGIAFIFELKADKEFALLNQVNDEQQVKVMRDGHPTVVPRKDIVVGDIVFIETGEEIPADILLLQATELQVDESSLTGEPICHKSINNEDFDKEATFPTNHVLRGTKVMEGHGIGEVLAVGDNTENGKVFKAAQIDDSVKTPLNEQLEKLGNGITKISYVLAALIIAGRIISYMHANDYCLSALTTVDGLAYVLKSLMLAVTLIVVAVPEGLPMAVTLSLAYSMRRMLKTNNLVRKMHACETMGAATVICTDKTGTLTQNKMQVSYAKFYGVNGLKNETSVNLAMMSMAVNSTALLDRSKDKTQVLGNPTEGALLLWLDKHGINYETTRQQVEKLREIPFSTEKKYMASLVKDKISGKFFLFAKGAPEIILKKCSDLPPKNSKQEILDELVKYQAKGMRTLAFALKIMREDEIPQNDSELDTQNLTFQGFVAISDPVRNDVPNAVNECLNAGINVKIITGDTKATAKEIARQINLWNDDIDNEDVNIKTGQDIANMSDEKLKECAQNIIIVARARPMDKKRMVEALQANNEVVAVTGDGTNDAPALKTAHVGLSMGDGTAVAKEASDITIIDNSFSSIGRAVMWGRSLYKNIQRFILFQMTVNLVACLVVLVGAFIGTESPLTVTQMLWVNLIMDTFAAMALASLPPTHQVMMEKPRKRKDFIINSKMWWNIIGMGGLFYVVLLGLLYVFNHADVNSLTDIRWEKLTKESLSPYELSLFFTFFVMLQFWNLFNAKAFAGGKSLFNLKDCKGFVIITTVILLGQILIVNTGGQFFNVVPISLKDWVIIIASTSLVALIGLLRRWLPK